MKDNLPLLKEFLQTDKSVKQFAEQKKRNYKHLLYLLHREISFMWHFNGGDYPDLPPKMDEIQNTRKHWLSIIEKWYKENRLKEWSIPDKDGNIDVPDKLMPLVNKVGMQIRFHTISGKNEAQTACDIVRIAEEFFTAKFNSK